jgi:glycosyltransferase involved in cell wall biosynthesis
MDQIRFFNFFKLKITVELKEFQELSNSYTTAEERGKLKQYLLSPPIHNNKRTIVFSTPSETGTSHFRLLEPIFAMLRNFPDEFNFIYTENLTANHFCFADVIIMHRASDQHSKFIEISKAWPKHKKRPLIIHDVDDNEFQLAKNHSMRQLWEAFEKDKHSLFAIKNSDYIFTTGKGLYDAFSKYNQKVRIFRNAFNWRLPQWNLEEKQKEYKEKYKDKIVLGYCGLSSHQDDIKKLGKAWKIIHDKYPNTHFIISGIVKVDIMYNLIKQPDGSIKTEEHKITDPAQTYRGRIMEYFKDFDQSRIEFQDSKNLEDYGEFYSQYDLNCVFIEQNMFGKCKSDIKAIEGLHYGALPIMSDWGPYHELYEKFPENLKISALKCVTETDREWAEKIGYWVENIETARDIAKKLKTFTDDLTDVDLLVNDRISYLKQIMDQHEEAEILRTTQYMNLSV